MCALLLYLWEKGTIFFLPYPTTVDKWWLIQTYQIPFNLSWTTISCCESASQRVILLLHLATFKIKCHVSIRNFSDLIFIINMVINFSMMIFHDDVAVNNYFIYTSYFSIMYCFYWEPFVSNYTYLKCKLRHTSSKWCFLITLYSLL